jgi:hypothetical protein
MMLRSSPPVGKPHSLRKFPNYLIINLDETPLPFEFLNGYSYNFKGVKTVAGKSERSGWKKRQATIILYIMADGSTPFKPVVIFHGKGTVSKRENYDKTVEINFNETAYNNEGLFHSWLRDTFEPYVAGVIKAGKTSLIVMDSASFHKTEGILTFIRTSETPIMTALIPRALQVWCNPWIQLLTGPSNNSSKKKQILTYVSRQIPENYPTSGL